MEVSQGQFDLKWNLLPSNIFFIPQMVLKYEWDERCNTELIMWYTLSALKYLHLI